MGHTAPLLPALLLLGFSAPTQAQTPPIILTGADAELEANIRASLRVRNEPVLQGQAQWKSGG
jgi:hypothetical protein